MMALYFYTLTYRLFITKSKERDNNGLGLSFVYLKHLVDILTTPNLSIPEYEVSRGVMWAFTTPLMLKMYCGANDLSLWDVNIQYHMISIVPHVFLIPFKGHPVYLWSTIILSIPAVMFLKSLRQYTKLPFTNMYILIWIVFILINALDITQCCSPRAIHAMYNIADTLCKFICNVVISNYNEQEIIVRENMDLQSVQFVSHIVKSIKEFENSNANRTAFCNDLIAYSKKKFQHKIPKSNSNLKLELLKKILPFDLDGDFVNRAGAGAGAGANKEYTFICVMFMDIVNYTELANRYKNGDTIFKLLNNVYNHFDNIIKNYSHLQKIETIGDAYMVVGDMYRRELNNKIVIKEMILLSLEFIQEIKKIPTPDNIPLCIRIGINLGNVNIGILGNEIPRLCVVGNSVNVAARLQSTAESNSIQMSRHVYEQAEEIDFGKDIDIEYIAKENVFLKNIGSVTTYNIMPN
jgi:class 3 adenylate cyclase